MTEQHALISVRNLTYKIGKNYLLKYINWEIKEGENWLVWGGNGSGKTTLLSILAGFKNPTFGKLTIEGQTLQNENLLEMRKKVGFVSTSFFDLHYKKEEVLDIVLSGLSGTLGVEFCDITNEKIKYAKFLLKQFNLEDRVHSSYDALSKGQRQCVLIARSIIMQPKILLLDEPLSGLDIVNKSKLLHTIEEWSSNKDMTIIFVTHDTLEIDNMFENTLFLKQGSVFAQGATKEIFTSENLSELYNYPTAITPMFVDKIVLNAEPYTI